MAILRSLAFFPSPPSIFFKKLESYNVLVPFFFLAASILPAYKKMESACLLYDGQEVCCLTSSSAMSFQGQGPLSLVALEGESEFSVY